jgi:hypothetical protein
LGARWRISKILESLKNERRFARNATSIDALIRIYQNIHRINIGSKNPKSILNILLVLISASINANNNPNTGIITEKNQSTRSLLATRKFSQPVIFIPPES